MAKRGKRKEALSYIRNATIPPELRRAEDRVRAGQESGLGKEVDRAIRKSAPGTGAIRLAREKARKSAFARSDKHQEYRLYTLDSAAEIRFLAPEMESERVYVQISPARDPGARVKVRPGRSPPKGGGSTKMFDSLLLPDVLERLSKSELDGPVDVVIRGVKGRHG
jgi:hypothetical protein